VARTSFSGSQTLGDFVRSQRNPVCTTCHLPPEAPAAGNGSLRLSVRARHRSWKAAGGVQHPAVSSTHVDATRWLLLPSQSKAEEP